MASILDRYGIKEVADVTFYHINEMGQPDYPVLFLDTLKVSTIEQTASDVSAQGGKGNPKLITWDYGKEINVTMEDALFSPKSMNLLFGGANAAIKKNLASDFTNEEPVRRSINFQAKSATALVTKANILADGSIELNANGTYDVAWYDEDGNAFTTGTPAAGDRFIGVIELDPSDLTKRNQITIDAAHFPGTYYITGDTYARNEVNGEDEFFQFIIYKAKVTAENSITLEAEGDPSTFNLNLTVLRNQDGKMMELVQYNV